MQHIVCFIGLFAKETYVCIASTNGSHPIAPKIRLKQCSFRMQYKILAVANVVVEEGNVSGKTNIID